jgi:hypothetical protein
MKLATGDCFGGQCKSQGKTQRVATQRHWSKALASNVSEIIQILANFRLKQ